MRTVQMPGFSVARAAEKFRGGKGSRAMPSTSFQTVSGIEFFPFAPRVMDIHIDDIAHALSRQCRFGGHVHVEHYSVAEHSVLVSRVVPLGDAMWGLMHDAEEAYFPDMIAPLKAAFPEYAAAGKQLMVAIAFRFGLVGDEPESVREADQRMLATELHDLTPCQPWVNERIRAGGYSAYPDANDRPRGAPPWAAKRMFLDRFRELGGTPL
jgi:hypothetical protein